MKEYIDRDKTIAEIDDCFPANPTSEFSKGVAVGLAMAKVAVNHTPAADVRPVVRGTWMKELHPNVRYNQYKCSVCGEFSGHDSEGWIWEPRFCPNCGALMEES